MHLQLQMWQQCVLCQECQVTKCACVVGKFCCLGQLFLEDTDGREAVAKLCNITGQELCSRMIFILDTARGNMNIC